MCGSLLGFSVPHATSSIFILYILCLFWFFSMKFVYFCCVTISCEEFTFKVWSDFRWKCFAVIYLSSNYQIENILELGQVCFGRGRAYCFFLLTKHSIFNFTLVGPGYILLYLPKRPKNQYHYFLCYLYLQN